MKKALFTLLSLVFISTPAFSANWEYYATRSNGTQHFYDKKSLRIITQQGDTMAYVTIKTNYTPREHIAYLGHQYQGVVTAISRELVDCSTKLDKTVRMHLFDFNNRSMKEWQITENNITAIAPGTIADHLYRAVCPNERNILNEKGYF